MDNYSDYLLLWSPKDKKIWYLDVEHEEFPLWQRDTSLKSWQVFEWRSRASLKNKENDYDIDRLSEQDT